MIITGNIFPVLSPVPGFVLINAESAHAVHPNPTTHNTANEKQIIRLTLWAIFLSSTIEFDTKGSITKMDKKRKKSERENKQENRQHFLLRQIIAHAPI